MSFPRPFRREPATLKGIRERSAVTALVARFPLVFLLFFAALGLVFARFLRTLTLVRFRFATM